MVLTMIYAIDRGLIEACTDGDCALTESLQTKNATRASRDDFFMSTCSDRVQDFAKALGRNGNEAESREFVKYTTCCSGSWRCFRMLCRWTDASLLLQNDSEMEYSEGSSSVATLYVRCIVLIVLRSPRPELLGFDLMNSRKT